MIPTLEPGTPVRDRYILSHILGSGSFGVVYQARDTQANPPDLLVAIKVMPVQSIVDCERQADVRALFQHPAIPRILDYFSDETAAYLVQDLISGWDLETVLTHQPGFLSARTVVAWAVQLCAMLDYLHNHPYFPTIFRDMKPNNVMVDRHNLVHVVDFGLARVFPPGFFQSPRPELAYLQKGLAIGTRGYSPPEQYDGYVTPQSDIYALGATLHHLLTRRDPRQNPAFSFEKAPIRALNPSISPALEAVVTRAVDQDIRRRFPTAKAMQQALEAVIDV